MSKIRKLWIGIGILIFLSPLGVIIPRQFGAGGAWGEWGPEAIEKVAGFVPAGMKQLAEKWKAPLRDYGLPGQSKGLAGESAGYVVAAIIGVAFTAGMMYLLARILGRKKDTDK
ncbi:MAG: PDGLE domain-containing protein [Nitrospirota bacterium]